MQTYIPGTEPPRNAEIDEAIERLYEAEAEAKRASDVKAVLRDVLDAKMAEAGISKYPYLEPGTGKRKILESEAIRKLRRRKAPSAKQARQDAEFERGRSDAEKAWTDEVERIMAEVTS